MMKIIIFFGVFRPGIVGYNGDSEMMDTAKAGERII